MLNDAQQHADQSGPAPAQVMEDNRLRPAFVADVRDALSTNDTDRVLMLVEQLHPADLADLIELTPGPQRRALVAALGDRIDADLISELNDWVRDEVVEDLTAHELADVVTELDTDDAVAILEEMDSDQQQQVLRALPTEERVVIEEALTYPEDSAGRLMQRDLIAVPQFWTIGQVIDYLRTNQDLTTEFWEIYVVDPQHHPVGTMRLSWVLRAPRSVLVTDVMQRDQTLIPVAMDQEDLAHKFQQYSLISAAVVDGNGRLAGMITVDDVVHIIQEEAGEDALKLAGAGEGDINEPVLQTARTRIIWLSINLFTALLASIVIGQFSGTIESLVALAVLMPIVSGMGGNAGTQTTTVTVRALATNQITASNAGQIFLKELRVGFFNGVSMSLLIGILAGTWFGCQSLGLVIGAAMFVNMIAAAMAGVLIPVTLDRLNVDPAVASSVFVTTVTDCMGFFGFLGLAALFDLGTRCT
jgi:magnesium transporter